MTHVEGGIGMAMEYVKPGLGSGKSCSMAVACLPCPSRPTTHCLWNTEGGRPLTDCMRFPVAVGPPLYCDCSERQCPATGEYIIPLLNHYITVMMLKVIIISKT